MKYNRIPEERRRNFFKILDYAFRPHEEEREYKDEDDFWEIVDGEYRGLFDGEDLLSVSTIIPFEIRSRGVKTKAGGISTVATPSENRHQGFVRRILKESFSS